MGQNVEIRNTVVMGDVLMIDTDRSLTGQDGQVLTPDLNGEGVPRLLAERLFGLGLGIDHMYVLQNTVTVRRPGGWDDESSRAVTDITHAFLRYYTDELEEEAGEGEDEAAEEGQAEEE